MIFLRFSSIKLKLQAEAPVVLNLPEDRAGDPQGTNEVLTWGDVQQQQTNSNRHQKGAMFPSLQP